MGSPCFQLDALGLVGRFEGGRNCSIFREYGKWMYAISNYPNNIQANDPSTLPVVNSGFPSVPKSTPNHRNEWDVHANKSMAVTLPPHPPSLRPLDGFTAWNAAHSPVAPLFLIWKIQRTMNRPHLCSKREGVQSRPLSGHSFCASSLLTTQI